MFLSVQFPPSFQAFSWNWIVLQNNILLQLITVHFGSLLLFGSSLQPLKKESMYVTKSRIDSDVSVVKPYDMVSFLSLLKCLSPKQQRSLKITSTFHATWAAFSFSIHNNKTNSTWQFHCSSPHHLFCRLNMHSVVLANKAKCCSETFHYMQGTICLESVTINPPNWSFWAAFGQRLAKL